ncbi:Coenzyme F420 hydrogenase/dehydrogenase, beta subunit C-terminal domain [Acinetobacter towneri]|uniref:Coenzyme F420 hydrogenase/dehydrogenase, beta subunit C-terminal domain n=1 Tax=Acinetobacter towneri TaxID=202956 RepID=A0AB35M508_9GAMM|nr:Coenzyme F420 hydrogenase/dehydrogenase, beta subunit C-terminal domain [Acinetobacter towneri]MDM1719801.1 Coenzyme F420 hydrogenase/dehydrogenase, beta subunit C-terminal domain [Acinetobacter towneri]MDM1731882.1 Coenzyme F420 hydrogenase/dehydrogenase, beta subunit C-terminal domain [Acinetobacter towneri]MDM1734558.1 Coenzyme F420 hydrogenase/dehydrogenase, beta subunit C-terminal domain [Acinetobacter towneri]MDM1739878.1 Coenzyme F420 hydrogenase/dehydrogenase, beta subunit C-terminal
MTIDLIVKNNLCTGCGVCISEDQSHQAKMIWNNEGFLVPSLGKSSTQDKMIKVCPFAIQQKNEDELGELFLKLPETQYHDKIGYYYGLYAGYSKQFRETSSSGGIATYVFNALLEQKIVDYLFIVKEVDGQYAYQFFSNVEEITQISKTRYTPVTLEKLFQELSKVDGKVAVSGVACFVKAIRLKQMYDPVLKEKIAFIVGIICGGLKSKYYTDYLAQEAGCKNEYNYAQYRVKNKESYALDYKFSCIEKSDKKIHMVDMQSLGDMWGTGLFKSNACDFCDDVLTELADISLGDAWIDPYDKNGLGNSIIITRTKIAENLIKNGLNKNLLALDVMNTEKIILSQNGSFNHRHKGLAFRVMKVNKEGKLTPRKRNKHMVNQNLLFNFVQNSRLKTRQKSLDYWLETRNHLKFKIKMKPYLENLKFFTLWNHRLIKLKKILLSKKDA